MDVRQMSGNILQGMPIGFALHQFVLDPNEKPCDYIFIDVNPQFEKMTGLAAAKILGKRLTDVLPNILNDSFDWIGTFAKTAYQGERQTFEQFSVPLNRWYRVHAYSPQTGFFVTLIEDISDEKKMAQRFIELQQVLKRQEIIINTYNLDTIDQQAFLRYVLQSALRMLDCKHGYIFLYDEAKEIFTIYTWSDDVMSDCFIMDQPQNYELANAGIWGEVVRQRAPIIVNDFHAPNPLKKGYPAGHVPIRNFASVPVVYAGSIVAVVGVANKETDFTTFDINQLTMLMQSAWLIKEAKDQIGQIRTERQKYSQILNRVPLMLCEFDQSLNLTYVNDALCAYFNRHRTELIGQPFPLFATRLFGSQDKRRFLQLSLHKPIVQHTQQIDREDGKHWVEWRDFGIFNEQGTAVAYYAVGVDITDREKVMKEIEYLAYHDYLTGIYNRRYFDESFNRMNTAENQPLAVIVGDINGLKLINDNYGHAAGDELIKAAVKSIRAAIKDAFVFSRTGGDEFAILLTQSSEAAASRLTNYLEEDLEQYIEMPGDRKTKIYLSVSFGYGVQNKNASSLDVLVREAENHIYKRKAYNDKSMRSHMIGAMLNTLFQKSEREERHSHRVSRYCELLARAMEWDVERVNRTRVAGSLHDIGKIGISEVILNKPDKLNDEEWVLMRQHPVKSAKILEDTEEYADIASIIAAHHERIDGSGYPRGLKGDEISLEARVIAIADAFDAMTQTRTYRSPMSRQEAISELYRCSGTQFDPLLVDVFVHQVLAKEEDRNL